MFKRYIYKQTSIGYNVIDTWSDNHVVISFENSPNHNAEFLAGDFCKRHNDKIS